MTFTKGDEPGVKLKMTSTDQPKPRPITPEQLRQARATLNWSRQRLSNASDTTLGFIQGYEEFGRVSRFNLRRNGFDGLAAIRDTLEQAGVDFSNDDPPGVKLAKSV